uniref:THAP-type domain-containing protein n=1 Tax=Macrostomum lignano TaxID=282301 RepID=A0A1I8FC02_9PLAT
MTASRRQCAAYGCQNYANKCPAQTRFHRFPANRERCEDWARRIFRADLLGKKNEARWKNAVVCSHHFPDSMYVCPDQRHEPGVRLMPTAYPMLQLYKEIAEPYRRSLESANVMSINYSSYPLSPQLWTSVGPTPTKAVVFHSDGFAVLDFEDCALKRPVAARLCGCHGGVGDNVNRDNEDQQLDGECDWVGDSGGHLLAAAGRLLFAALPLQQRLLAIESPAASSTKAWFSPRLLELGCRPRLLSYRRQSDTLWTACDAGRVLRLSRASSVAAAVADAEIWRVGSAGIRVLRLPDSTANLLVTLEGASASSGDGFALMVAAGVPDFDSRGGSEVDERARLLLPDSIDRADVIPQGDTLLLHSSKNFSQTPLIAVDLTTGKRIPFFSRFFSSNPTGRLVVSERADRVLHLTADTMYLYRVLPSGQLALRMHSSLDAWPLYPQFQTGPDGSERLLALADLPDGGLMAVSPGEATVRLNFDPRTRELKRLAASQFGSLALAYSANSAVFVNTSFASAAGVTSSASTDACQQILFVGLQAVHWVWPDYPDES